MLEKEVMFNFFVYTLGLLDYVKVVAAGSSGYCMLPKSSGCLSAVFISNEG